MIPAITEFTEKALSHVPETYPLMRLYYGSIVEREIQLAGIKRHDRVLCVGGGAFPATAMEICRKTGAAVDVLDCDADAVFHARELLRKMGMWQIFVHHGCGQTFDPSPYTVVHVALQVRGRDKILANLRQKAEANTRVLVRLPREGLERFYDRSCDARESTWDQVQTWQSTTQPGGTMKGTCMLIKEVVKHGPQKPAAHRWHFPAGAAHLAHRPQ